MNTSLTRWTLVRSMIMALEEDMDELRSEAPGEAIEVEMFTPSGATTVERWDSPEALIEHLMPVYEALGEALRDIEQDVRP